MFSKDGSAEISDKYVAVKLLGGNDLDDEGKAVMKRYGIGGYPTLLGLDSDGALLQTEFSRSTEGIVKAMEGAAEAKVEFAKKLKEYEAKKDDVDLQRGIADLYLKRRQMKEARPMLEAIAKQGKADDLTKLLSCLQAMDDKDAAKGLMGTLVEKFPDHEQYASWRMTLAMADLEQPSRELDREENKKRFEAIADAIEGLLKDTQRNPPRRHSQSTDGDEGATRQGR